LYKAVVCAIALFSILNLVVNSASAHVMACRPNDRFDENGQPIFRQICEAIDAGGYIDRHYPALYAVTPYLTWLGMFAFFGSIAFGIFVLFKNRARKVAC
jgi:hypothetical protein